jgi:hypothetical protein
MSRCQLRLPVLVRARITPLQHALQLFVGPGVEVDGFDFANVRAHAAVYAGAANAHEDTQVPASPSRVYTCQHAMSFADNLSRTLVALAVGTCFIALELDQIFEGCSILFGTISGRVGPPRHGGVLSYAQRGVVLWRGGAVGNVAL